MCLDKITRRLKPTQKIKKAWKGMTLYANNQLAFPVRDEYKVARGKWMRAKEIKVRSLMRKDGYWQPVLYTSGFHVYDKKYRRLLVWGCEIIPCEVKGVHTIGTQDGRRVMVARWIRFPGEARYAK